MNEWEYRVLAADGWELGNGDDLAEAAAFREQFDRDYPDDAPHRVERRRVGPWEPVGESRDTEEECRS